MIKHAVGPSLALIHSRDWPGEAEKVTIPRAVVLLHVPSVIAALLRVGVGVGRIEDPVPTPPPITQLAVLAGVRLVRAGGMPAWESESVHEAYSLRQRRLFH